MKLPLVVLAMAALLLPVTASSGTMPASTKGKAYVASVSDDRVFQNKPSTPSTPSIDGDANAISAALKDRMIGRQGNGVVPALGDTCLPEGDSVTRRVRLLVEEGLRREGYEVASAAENAVPVRVSIDTFWAWTTPGTSPPTITARVVARVTFVNPTGLSMVLVLGEGTHPGRAGNWMEAYSPAFEDFLASFKRETDKIAAAPGH